MPCYVYVPALCALLLVMFAISCRGAYDWSRRRYGRFYRLVGFWVFLPVTNATRYLKAYTDVNGNGTFEADADILVSKAISSIVSTTTTIIKVGDVDGDRLPDVVERREGTDPYDAKNYCFDMSVLFTGVFTTTNQLAVVACLGTNVVYSAVAGTNDEWLIELGHLATSKGETVSVRFWDDVDGDGLYATNEVSSVATYAPSGHENVITNQLAFQGFDQDHDNILDSWEIVHGLCPTNSSDALIDLDGDGLINLHEYWADCDPMLPDGSNTALSVFSRAVDSRLPEVSQGRIRYYSVASGNEIVKNSSCWAYDIVLNCQSPFNLAKHKLRSGTLISPQHLVFANHYDLGVSNTIYFQALNGGVITNVLLDSSQIGSTDIRIGILKDKVNADDVPVAHILPIDYQSYLGDFNQLPFVAMNQNDDCLVMKKDWQIGATLSVGEILSGRRALYSGRIHIGDSGDPVFLVDDTVPIIIFEMHNAGAGNDVVGFDSVSGPLIHLHKEEIQDAMNRLSGRHGLANEFLVEHDFSRFTKLKNWRGND